MTFLEQVGRDALIAPSAFKVKSLTDAMQETAAIVFIYAGWSGPAIRAWRTLTAALSSSEGPLNIIVVDADEFQPDTAIELLGGLPQGKGETFWIKGGKIVSALRIYQGNDTATILQYTESLIA